MFIKIKSKHVCKQIHRKKLLKTELETISGLLQQRVDLSNMSWVRKFVELENYFKLSGRIFFLS